MVTQFRTWMMATTPLVAAIFVPAPLMAQDRADAPSVVAEQPAEGESPFTMEPVSNKALRGIAGREDVSQDARSTHTAEVTDNSVGDNVTTGDVSITDNALQNLSGLSVFNINTGNNVAVNASLNVNISMSPQP